VHGYPRATGDIDVWIAVSELNVNSLLQALTSFGAPGDISGDFFFEPGNVFRMGNIPMKIEILTSVSGVEFEACYGRRKTITIDDMKITFIGLPDLIANKRASGRAKDLADLENLGSEAG
jgi:hypothetical protein